MALRAFPGGAERCYNTDHGRCADSPRRGRLRRVHARLDLGSGAGVSATDLILLVVAVMLFCYLGYALFRAEKF